MTRKVTSQRCHFPRHDPFIADPFLEISRVSRAGQKNSDGLRAVCRRIDIQ
jgi:hypothetical protein